VDFEKGTGKNTEKIVINKVGDTDAYFILGQDGDKHEAQFRMLKYYCYPSYFST